MELWELLKFVHIATAIIWVGGAVTLEGDSLIALLIVWLMVAKPGAQQVGRPAVDP